MPRKSQIGVIASLALLLVLAIAGLTLAQDGTPGPIVIPQETVDAAVQGLFDATATAEAEIAATGTIQAAFEAAQTATAFANFENDLAATATAAAAAPTPAALDVGELGVGYEKGFWTVYFNAPSGSSDASTYVGGIDVQLASAIDAVQNTLDIAAFEFNNEVLTEAVLNAHERGVQVRIVTDDEHGLEEEDESIPVFIEAGIPVIDDDRSALMHNKFMIMDSETVWTGSWNYTVNGTYRNNNNALVMRAPGAVEAYQAEFDEMFLRGEFGPRSTQGIGAFVQDGVPVGVLFASEDDVIIPILDAIFSAEENIRFMAFSFTQDDIGQAMIEQGQIEGVTVQGVFELRGSETQFSEMPPMFCAGFDVRQDGNPYTLHHKVIIIDDHTVLTGSFNFSANATESNDENLVIIRDPDLATLYIEEFERRFAEAAPPPVEDVDCE